MADMNDLYSASSRESEIDALIDQLIAKIMAGTADRHELIEYEELVASRTRLMRPKPSRFSAAHTLRRKYA